MMMIKWAKHNLLVLVFVALFACSGKTNDSNISRPIKTEKVLITFAASVDYISGEVSAGAEVTPSFAVSGLLTKMCVSEGSKVHKGQLLAEINATDYQAAFIAAESKYQQVNAEVARVEELYKHNSVSKNEYEKAISGRQSIASLYETAKNQLYSTKLYSPIDGIVQSIDAGMYQTTMPGVGVLTIVSIDALSVETNITSNMFIKRDNIASFEAYSQYTKEIIPLKLTFIAPKANNNQLYKVKLAVDKKYTKNLATGMTLQIKVSYKPTLQQEISVVLPAVFNEDGKNYVWCVDTATFTAEKRQIVTGNLNKEGNIVVLDGLKEGETVITAGVHNIENGQKIRVLK
jgi:RND family efflux transporter MFP subunit